MSKKAARLVASTDELKGVLTWNFNAVDGVTPEPIVFDVAAQWDNLNRLYPIGAKAMMHGFKQKISDAGAMSADTTTGKVDPKARIEKMRRVAESLSNGDWELQRTGGGATGGLLAKALCEVMKKEMDVIREFLKGKTEAEKNALRQHGPIARVIARLESEAAADVDVAGLLAGLGDEGEESSDDEAGDGNE